jgi:Cu(I)/Ag(I) efflux system membrane protein CusA/SilA
MIAYVIRWSVANRFLILLGTLFIIGAGVWAVRNTPLDAIPDLSDVQVIVYTDYPGQAPQVVEDQVTYPLTTALLTVPKSKTVRGFSFFGSSFVYVVFEDGTDLYWARSRVLEYLSQATQRLPPGVTPSLGPDATGVGWVYEYVVTGAQRTLAELRSIQDWFLRFQLSRADGVAEVAGHRSAEVAGLRHPIVEGHGRHPQQQSRCRWSFDRDVRDRVPRAWPRLSARGKRHRADRSDRAERRSGTPA